MAAISDFGKNGDISCEIYRIFLFSIGIVRSAKSRDFYLTFPKELALSPIIPRKMDTFRTFYDFSELCVS